MNTRRKNPLHPDAWLTETHKFDLPGERASIRLGVHVTSHERATLYAVNKASQQGKLEFNEPNCGIILTLDMHGLKPLPEADAIAAKHDAERDVLYWLKDFVASSFGGFNQDDSADDIALEFANYFEDANPHQDNYGAQVNWFRYVSEEIFDASISFIRYMVDLANEDPDRLVKVMMQILDKNEISLEVWADVLSQHRYMAEVISDRLLLIEAVHPVHPVLSFEDDEFGFEEDEDEEEKHAQKMSFDNLLPSAKVIWNAGERQIRLALDEPQDIRYHGTDISRARLAFPELAEIIRCPWKYGQPAL